jgi:hypothetical protein
MSFEGLKETFKTTAKQSKREKPSTFELLKDTAQPGYRLT